MTRPTAPAWWATPLTLATFAHGRDRTPRPARSGWQSLASALTTFQVADVADKLDLPAWSPTLYRDGATRGADGVIALSCLVLDYDDGGELEEASATWGNWAHVAHTTYSHDVFAPRFRLVLPLAAPCPVLLWPRVWAWAEERSGRAIDPACKDPARLWFVPRHRTGADFARLRVDGKPLELDYAALPQTATEALLAERRERARLWRDEGRVALDPGPATREQRARYREDPITRAELAAQLGMRVSGNTARGATCPRCGSRSVWFLIEPAKNHFATCNHKESCGWWDFADELLG